MSSKIVLTSFIQSHILLWVAFLHSCLHFKLDFLCSIIVFAEKSFLISWHIVVVEISLDIWTDKSLA